MRRTASQTIGPFFRHALVRHADETIAGPGVEGESIRVEGKVTDADGVAVADAILEIFQADAQGRHPSADNAVGKNAGFSGFGRAATDEAGNFCFTTIHPGAGSEAPHLDIMVFARGLLKPLLTRIYFAGDPGNAADAVLQRVPAARQHTLLARREAASTPACWRFDVRLQGEGETVFFDF